MTEDVLRVKLPADMSLGTFIIRCTISDSFPSHIFKDASGYLYIRTLLSSSS
jgi:hypothetical protein